MTFAEQQRVKAEQCRQLADSQSALGHDCDLVNVREKHETAAAKWNALAEFAEGLPEGR
jgi:hypothetical protein